VKSVITQYVLNTRNWCYFKFPWWVDFFQQNLIQVRTRVILRVGGGEGADAARSIPVLKGTGTWHYLFNACSNFLLPLNILCWGSKIIFISNVLRRFSKLILICFMLIWNITGVTQVPSLVPIGYFKKRRWIPISCFPVWRVSPCSNDIMKTPRATLSLFRMWRDCSMRILDVAGSGHMCFMKVGWKINVEISSQTAIWMGLE
jgi:hypothetical protein